MIKEFIFVEDSTPEEAQELKEFLLSEGHELYDDGSALGKYFPQWPFFYFSGNYWVGSRHARGTVITLQKFLQKYKGGSLKDMYEGH